MESSVAYMGSASSMAARMAQAGFSISSLLFMFSIDVFYAYSSFCFLAFIMAMMMVWGLILAIVDGLCICLGGHPTRRSLLIWTVVVFDWIFAFMSLAASCATASSAEYLYSDNRSCIYRYHISAFAAFLCSVLLFITALSNLWILPGL